jgi:hypothetical protein
MLFNGTDLIFHVISRKSTIVILLNVSLPAVYHGTFEYVVVTYCQIKHY